MDFQARATPIGTTAIGIVAGCTLQLHQPGLWGWGHYVGAALLALLVCLPGPRWPAAAADRLRTLAWCAAIALLAFSLTGLRAVWQSAQALAPELERQDVQVVGVVAAMPQVHEAGVRFVFDVEQAWRDGRPAELPPRLVVGWYSGFWLPGELQRQPLEIVAGERWRFTLRLKAPHGNVNPHGFDYELWLWEQGVGATATVRATARDAPPQRIEATWQHPVEQLRQRVRDAIVATVTDRRLAGVVAALAVGDQRSIDRADWDMFRATGVAHLLSVSGLHITMFAWLAVRGVGAAWRRSARLCLWQPAPQAALVCACVLAAGYALLSGWGLPAQRTVWMLVLVSALRLAGLRWPWPQVWLTALGLLALLDPWGLLQPGFWLSFVAVGVLFASGPAQLAPLKYRGGTVLVRLFAMVREQWWITLALAPLTLLLFGQISLIGLAANLLAIPWVTLLVTPLALLGMLWAPLWQPAAWAVDALLRVLQQFAGVPWAVWSAPAPAAWASALAVFGGLWLALRLPWALRLLAVPLMLPALLWQPPRPAPGEFELLALDVGQGNAVLVRTANHALLYDAGPRYSREADAGHRVITPLLRALGERLDVLMLSHGDTDHVGGAAAVLAQHPQVRLSSSIAPDHPLSQLRDVQPCRGGQRWSWDAVEFEVLHPDASQPAQERGANAYSCVLRIRAGSGRSALLAGDIERAQEEQLVAQGLRGPLDWLLVPHHGSKTSSADVLLDALQPALAVVQAGHGNRFGHPAPSVTERYQARAIPVVNTAQCGALSWASGRPHDWTCERARAPRYWQHRLAVPRPACTADGPQPIGPKVANNDCESSG